MNLKEIRKAERNTRREDYIHRGLVALDIFINVLTGGNEDETISSRVRRVSDAHKGFSWNPGVWIAKTLNTALDIVQRDHGQHAEAGDLQRAETVERIEDHALDIARESDGGSVEKYYCNGADPACPGSDKCPGHEMVGGTWSSV